MLISASFQVAREPVWEYLRLRQTQIVASTRIGKADGTGKIAPAGNLNNTDTGMLLVLRTQPAIKGATSFHRIGEVSGDAARFIILQRI